MNSIKTVLVVVVLAVVAGAVYVLINNNSATTTPPSELADGWSDSPSVEMPDLEVSGPPFGASAGASPDVSTAAEQALGGGMAPPFSPTDSPDGLTGRPPLPGSAPDASLPSDVASAGAGSGEVREAFARFMEAARKDLEQDRLAEVHQTLSLWYDNPQLTPEENRQLTELLDQVAGAVVYSRQHLLERPYTVQAGDNLQRIGRAYGVPWQLLAKINGISDPENLEPGRELKVIRGPFDAVVDLEKHEMTLKLRGLYAGRFQIGVGRSQEELEGTYFVEDKIVQSDDSNSPLGRYWIKLNDRIGIHGTNDPRNIGADDGPGAISLDDRDIEDVHDILSIGSRVQILR
ncbi:MAG TPA: LysM peptidoglycan-binding domain-containing protein [Thermoguttaceae bacterium]|nr:LysM peptidoglycan-binding domain-containing protein [Thermoguttaceae bacterium]